MFCFHYYYVFITRDAHLNKDSSVSPKNTNISSLRLSIDAVFLLPSRGLYSAMLRNCVSGSGPFFGVYWVRTVNRQA